MAKEWAQKFVHGFYENMANDRSRNLMLYREGSQLSYNGSHCATLQQIKEKFENFSYKTMLYKFDDIDVQQVGANGILIVVNGKLNLDNENTFSFCETFMIIFESQEAFYIQNEVMQLIL